MSKQESGEYNGPDSNPLYEDVNGEIETFDDLDEDGSYDDVEVQGGTADADKDVDDVVGEDGGSGKPKGFKPDALAKKNKGQKDDAMDLLEDNVDEEDEDKPAKKPKAKDEDEDEDEAGEDLTEEKSEEPEQTAEEKTAAAAAEKAKKVYLKMGEDTFAVPNDAIIPVPINGKKVPVPLKDLMTDYSGKVAYAEKFNELNLKNISLEKEKKAHTQKVSHFSGLETKIRSIAADSAKNPMEIVETVLDTLGLDSYDLKTRLAKHELPYYVELMNMSEADRKAHFLERDNAHLRTQAEKREARQRESEQATTWRSQVEAERKSYGVTEDEYLDAVTDLESKGWELKNITPAKASLWAATKPHRESVAELLKPYEDQLSEEVLGKTIWDLSNLLLKKEATKEELQVLAAEVFGPPTEIKDLSKKLNPIGRKAGTSKTPPTPPKKGRTYESFEDLEEED